MHIAVVVGFILAALAVFYFSGALSVLVLLVLVALLIVTGGSSAMPSRRCIFVYNLVVACILAALIVLYFKNSTLHNLIPAPLQGMPVYSLWFGALGGLVISFKGIYEHAVGAPPAGWAPACWYMTSASLCDALVRVSVARFRLSAPPVSIALRASLMADSRLLTSDPEILSRFSFSIFSTLYTSESR